MNKTAHNKAGLRTLYLSNRSHLKNIISPAWAPSSQCSSGPEQRQCELWVAKQQQHCQSQAGASWLAWGWQDVQHYPGLWEGWWAPQFHLWQQLGQEVRGWAMGGTENPWCHWRYNWILVYKTHTHTHKKIHTLKSSAGQVGVSAQYLAIRVP